MSEEKIKKPLHKKRRFRVIVFIFICWILNSLAKDWNTSSNTTTVQQKTETIEKKDVIQERINHFIETRQEVEEFEKIELIDTNTLWIYFTATPDLWIEDSIDQTTRWQARNLSIDIDWVASVKTFVWWQAQMFCTATKWQVNDCIDYR